jgi:putative phosphoesterase
MRVGVVSDTHGLIRPEMIGALDGVSLILHAGDIGAPEVLQALAKIAPLVAVRGNNDRGSWAEKLAETEAVAVGAASLYLLHDVAELDLDLSAAGFHAVVFGHSHQPQNELRDGVLYFNPGSAGPRRFSLPVTIGRLEIQGDSLQGEIVSLLSK